MSFKIHFLNVGQGDTAIIELPNAQFMLVDCNQREDVINILEYIKGVIPLKNNKYFIDYIVLTHPHKDHIRGLKDIIGDKEISIGEIWESGHRTRDDDEEYKNYVEIMNRSDLNIVKVKAASFPFREFDGIKVHIFAPGKYITEDEKNDPRKAVHSRCMVMRIEYNNKSILFTGDSSFDCWKERIVPNYSDDNENLKQNLLKSDILSVSHHGSRSFFMDKKGDKVYKKGIKKISPSVCIISVGDKNEHGHPHREAMRIYKKESDDIYITKDDGTFIINLENLDVKFTDDNKKINSESLNMYPMVEVGYSRLSIDESAPEEYKEIYNSDLGKKDIKVRKGGSLKFKLLNENPDYKYKWLVRNSGREVWLEYFKSLNKTHLRNESEGALTKRDLRWKGRHKMTCQMINKDGEIISKSTIRVRIVN